jgi:hypothetical protein
MGTERVIYPDASRIDALGVSILGQLLGEDTRISIHLQSGDKRPNLDGYIEILNNEKNSIASFDVQIKST